MTDMDISLPEPDGLMHYVLLNGRRPSAWSEDQVRAIVATEVAKEREKCAKVCEATYQEHKNGRWVTLPQFDGGEDCAAAIRAAAPPQCTAPPSEPQ
mgnify:CR=1 FL=1